MNHSTLALIPAYEPGTILLDLLVRLRQKNMTIILVDDGSGPAYADLFAKAATYATVLTCTTNQGKGTALKTGLSYIQNHYKEPCVIVTVDADGQHTAEDALRLCHRATEREDALILGSRKLNTNVPLKSQLGNTITRYVYSAATGLHVRDTQTGLRAFSISLIPQLLEISGERYEYEMNVLLDFSRKHIPILEEEIDTLYFNNNAASHFDTLKDSYRIYKEILKFSASSFVGFLVDYAMYSLLLLSVTDLLIANIGARIVSATVNYVINRRYVFQSNNGIGKSAMQYFLLATGILAGNTFVLYFLVNCCHINQMLAKILTEILLFSISWFIQKCFIFRKRA